MTIIPFKIASMNFNGKTNVFAKIWTREFLRKHENFRYYFFLKTFVLKMRKNEEKNDIRGTTNCAQFIFYQIFNVNRLVQLVCAGLCLSFPNVSRDYKKVCKRVRFMHFSPYKVNCFVPSETLNRG